MTGSTAARVRETKEKHPERYCANKRCLWNTSSKPCPKHPNMQGQLGTVTDADRSMGVA